MNLHWIDWSIVLTLLVFMVIVVVTTKHYMRGVADFLAANRCAGRYLLCVSDGIAGLGAITLLAFWEMYYKTGFTAIWWSLLDWPILFVIALSGWVLYRFRQTRSMTMAQFFEMRYGRSFRIFAGIVAFVAGTINFGIFPSVGANFFINFCGLPEQFELAGVTLNSYPMVIVILLGIALFFTFAGGQIAVILTDFIQGTFCMIVLTLTCLFLMYRMDWQHVCESLMDAPEGASLVNPMKTGKIEGFNFWFFIIQWFFWIYYWKAWQGNQAYNCSARTPHEARMSQVLGTWRYFAQQMLVPILAVCAIAFLKHPDFAADAAGVENTLAGIENEAVRTQMTVPVALSQLLPVGLMGGLVAVMFAAFISTHDTYLHSWGSIFIQDVVMPLRKKPLEPKRHLLLLRCSISGVAVFIFLWSLCFRHTDYIRMFFAITGAIYLSGAGTCIIGGLYWKRGTTAGAFSAMILGAFIAVLGIMCQQITAVDETSWHWMVRLRDTLHSSETLRAMIDYVGNVTGQVMSFYAAASAIAVYVLVSLLSAGRGFNLDRMLHRGAYAVASDTVEGHRDVTRRWMWLGINEEFTRRDKALYLSSAVWIGLWTVIFLTGTIYALVVGGENVSDDAWLVFWHCIVWMAITLAILTTLWLTIGGVFDLKQMFLQLRTTVRDDSDDGTVRAEEPAVRESL